MINSVILYRLVHMNKNNWWIQRNSHKVYNINKTMKQFRLLNPCQLSYINKLKCSFLKKNKSQNKSFIINVRFVSHVNHYMYSYALVYRLIDSRGFSNQQNCTYEGYQNKHICSYTQTHFSFIYISQRKSGMNNVWLFFYQKEPLLVINK